MSELRRTRLYSKALALFPFTTPQGGKADADKMIAELDEEKARLNTALEAKLEHLRTVRSIVCELRRSFEPNRPGGRGWFKPKQTIKKGRAGPK
jgi:hypothetical protein